MNFIASALLYHVDEVMALEIIVRLLNDYHLKEVHMPRMLGLYTHCDVAQAIIASKLPRLS